MAEKRNKNRFFGGLLGRSQKFIELREWFNQRLTIDARRDPGNSITLVDDTLLAIDSPQHLLRFISIAPFILAWWGLFFYIIGSFGPNDSMISHAHFVIKHNEDSKRHGRTFDTKRDLYYRTLIGSDGEGSKFSLIKSVSLYGSEGYRNRIYGEIVIMMFLLFISLVSTIFFLRLPRAADLYFDRQRRIVYSWRRGKVAACHFDNLGYRETVYGLEFSLYGEHKKRNYWTMHFGLLPSGRPYFNTEDDNTELMMQVFAFMDKGKNAIITGRRFLREPAKYYLYVDEKPENFEQRVEEILKRDHKLPELYTKYLD